MSERLIQEIADTMMRDMFAPHELPVDAELQAKYTALARKIAALPGVLPQPGFREALAKFFESFEGSWNGAAIASQVRNFVHAGSEPQGVKATAEEIANAVGQARTAKKLVTEVILERFDVRHRSSPLSRPDRHRDEPALSQPSHHSRGET